MRTAQSSAVGIIGAGRVGTALATLWHEAGLKVVAISSLHAERSETLAAVLPGARAVPTDEMAALCDVVVICVPDDVIPVLVSDLTQQDWTGCIVAHVSGAVPVSVLDPVRLCGAMIGGIHPALAFTEVDAARREVPGATFALEAAESYALDILNHLVKVLRGRVILLQPETRPIYHAALVILSNYTVTLYAVAARLLNEVHAEKTDAHQVLLSLLHSTVANLDQVGIPDALTGPLVRGDVQTIHAHIQALAFDPDLQELYRNLGRHTLPLVQARGGDVDVLKEHLK